MKEKKAHTWLWLVGLPQGPSGPDPKAAFHIATAACSSRGFPGHFVWIELRECDWGKGIKNEGLKKSLEWKNIEKSFI